MLLYTIAVIPFKLQMAAVGIIAFLVWFFILRKYRSLGLRLFFLFSLIAAFACYWLYTDISDTKSMKQNGLHLTATVTKKLKINSESGRSQDNQITVSFQYPAGNTQTANTSTYISKEEYETLQIGQSIEVLYNPINTQVYYNVSFTRYMNDQWFMYFFPAFLFVAGTIAGIIFRKYKVGVHEDTGDEYLEKDGKIYLDESGNDVARYIKAGKYCVKIVAGIPVKKI